MNKKKALKLTFALSALVGGMTSCGNNVPQVVPTSYETVTIEKHAAGERTADEDLRDRR